MRLEKGLGPLELLELTRRTLSDAALGQPKLGRFDALGAETIPYKRPTRKIFHRRIQKDRKLSEMLQTRWHQHPAFENLHARSDGNFLEALKQFLAVHPAVSRGIFPPGEAVANSGGQSPTFETRGFSQEGHPVPAPCTHGTQQAQSLHRNPCRAQARSKLGELPLDVPARLRESSRQVGRADGRSVYQTLHVSVGKCSRQGHGAV